MNILIVDDHPLFIDGLTHFFNNLARAVKVFEASSFDSAMTIFEAQQFDLVLIDFNLSDECGLELLSAFIARDTNTPLVIISGEDDPSIAKQALDLGACGFFNKTLTPNELREAIDIVLQGGEFLSNKIRKQVDRLNMLELTQYTESLSHGMTPRQLEVLALIAKGHTNKRISQILNISPETVKEHVKNLFMVLDADNRMMCITQAKKLGLKLDG